MVVLSHFGLGINPLIEVFQRLAGRDAAEDAVIRPFQLQLRAIAQLRGQRIAHLIHDDVRGDVPDPVIAITEAQRVHQQGMEDLVHQYVTDLRLFHSTEKRGAPADRASVGAGGGNAVVPHDGQAEQQVAVKRKIDQQLHFEGLQYGVDLISCQ